MPTQQRRAADQKEAVNHPEHYGGDTTYESRKITNLEKEARK